MEITLIFKIILRCHVLQKILPNFSVYTGLSYIYTYPLILLFMIKLKTMLKSSVLSGTGHVIQFLLLQI